ncbi:MAG: hypothetical protein VX681_13540 [Myxococcota bacterium]|nr:hypothetical protein [Myxococcota bacterium]
MSSHPLIELANDSGVKTPASFREAADALTGQQLADLYAQERATAAEDASAKIQHFVGHAGTIEGESVIEDKELAIAIFNQCRLDGVPLILADGASPIDPDDVDDQGIPATRIDLLDYAVPVTTLAPSKIKARHRVISALDLVGVTAEERLAVARVRLMPPRSTKGDTPLRALIEGLAQCAVAEGYRSTLSAQIEASSGRTISADPPRLVVLANNRYWEIYRRRSLKSAGPWMAALRRVGGEIEQALGIPVAFASIKLYGDPPWRVRQGMPQLASDPAIRNGLDPIGNELKPKWKLRNAAKEDAIVEANLERTPVPYSLRESYEPGDRISHPKLGEGVVQKALGPNKVEIRFGDESRVLVQGRS